MTLEELQELISANGDLLIRRKPDGGFAVALLASEFASKDTVLHAVLLGRSDDIDAIAEDGEGLTIAAAVDELRRYSRR